MIDSGSTLDDLADRPRNTRTTWGIRLGIGMLALVVIAAATAC